MIAEAIRTVAEERRDLPPDRAEEAISSILTGEASPAQTAALLAALRTKGETAGEILGCARAMLGHAGRIDLGPGRPIPEDAVDIGGTGGDRAGTFNISTVAALVAAGVGVPVLKHGNRAVTSRAGSADLMEALGVPPDIEARPDRLARSLDVAGLAYMLTPAFYRFPETLSRLRREIGVRSVFNLAGPLANPAGVRRQVVGVAHPDLIEPVAEVLLGLGRHRALVVHGLEGLDEISPTGPTRAADIAGGRITTSFIEPRDFGLAPAPIETIRGGDARRNAAIALAILSGEHGGPRTAVLLCAGAALVVAGRTTSFAEGAEMAAESIDSGRAKRVLDRLRGLR